MLKLEYKPYRLDFKFDAGTSRGVMRHRDVWFIKVYDDRKKEIFGIGEIAPLDRLSLEDVSTVAEAIEQTQLHIADCTTPQSISAALDTAKQVCPGGFRSIRFGLETALLDLVNGGKRIIFKNDFTDGKGDIKINGLIWMGDPASMKDQIKEKVMEGFDCIKIKIGAIDFEEEKSILQFLRTLSEEITLRVDANGAFQNNESLRKLIELSEFNIHSIEQPIIPNQLEAMQLLCKNGAIKIALDEELIAIQSSEEKVELLDLLKPHFLVLKPSLLGGIEETREWIDLAEARGIGWWITSALESNIGLNAISQFTYEFNNSLHQGLGTGKLFYNNIDGPLTIKKGILHHDSTKPWNLKNRDLF